MRLFAFSTLVFSLACICGGGAEEDTGSSRRRSSSNDDTADTADTGTTDTGTTDTGGNDTGTTDTGTTDTGGNDTGSGSTDADRDGWTLAEGDCDDANRSINPGMDEVCNGEDDDCDFSVDEDNVCGSADVRVQLSYGGQFQATRSTYTSGKFGFAYVNDAGVATCTAYGPLTRTATAPTGCPSCDWSFDLSATGTGTVAGSGCANMTDFTYTPTGLAGYTSGYWDYSWGFATSATYAGTTVSHAVFIHDGTSWKLMSADETYGNWSGSSSNFTFNRPFQNGSFYYYYTP